MGLACEEHEAGAPQSVGEARCSRRASDLSAIADDLPDDARLGAVTRLEAEVMVPPQLLPLPDQPSTRNRMMTVMV